MYIVIRPFLFNFFCYNIINNIIVNINANVLNIFSCFHSGAEVWGKACNGLHTAAMTESTVPTFN
jgi:hypothetical protein